MKEQSASKAERTKGTRRSRLRLALAVTTTLSVLLAMLSIAPQSARASFDVPEIDPSSMAGALTLLVGGVLALTDRIRRV